jgi:agmatine deiminase
MNFSKKIYSLENSPSGVGGSTPRELGYYFPAEFAPQAATWLSWPHK